MTAARLRLAPVLVVIARWSMDMVVIFITSVVLCTDMIEGEQIGSFSQKKSVDCTRKKKIC